MSIIYCALFGLINEALFSNGYKKTCCLLMKHSIFLVPFLCPSFCFQSKCCFGLHLPFAIRSAPEWHTNRYHSS